MSHIIFWQNILSPHNSAWIRALAATDGVRVTIVAERETESARKALGWSVPHFGRAVVITCSDPKVVGNLIQDAGEDAVHVVGPMRSVLLTRHALCELTRRRARIGVISEAPDGAGWRGLVRRCIYRRDRARFATSIDFLLAMGTYAVDWFAEAGYPGQKLFPFAYITERHRRCTVVPAGSGPAALVYVGRFLPTKGPDVLLRALVGLKELDWGLTMIGEGPLKENCRRIAHENGFSGRVRITGPLTNQEAVLGIARSDLLVLPSRHDGWGAVVNEALMEGVPVICSDCCGARDLLQEPWRGEVFIAGSVASLRETLRRWIPAKRTGPLANRIRNWSSAIEGESFAAYFLSILDCVYSNATRPTPPYLRPAQELSTGAGPSLMKESSSDATE
jgi:glycosyltransferase involved in cell wall biosynthesis